MTTTLFRTVIVYAILIISLKLMGKRQIGEIQLSEFVITLLIAELASYSVMDSDIPLIYVFVPIITLIAAEIIVSYIGLKSRAVKNFVEPAPSILIERGVIIEERLMNVRFTISELISEVRLKGYADITAVDYAILESNGKLSVIPKPDEQSLSAGEFRGANKIDTSGIMHPVVVGGELSPRSIAQAGKTPEWVMKTAADHGYTGLGDIFLMLADNADKVFIQPSVIKNRKRR